jgi:hypothetical protein
MLSFSHLRQTRIRRKTMVLCESDTISTPHTTAASGFGSGLCARAAWMPDHAGMMPEERVPLAERAGRLDLAYDTARKHLSAGPLRDEKHQGCWWVWVPVPDNAGPMLDPFDTMPGAVIARLESEVACLRAELVSRTEDVRCKDQLLARVPERIPERAATGEDAPQDARTSTPRDAAHDRIPTPRLAQRTLRGQPGNASGAR